MVYQNMLYLMKNQFVKSKYSQIEMHKNQQQLLEFIYKSCTYHEQYTSLQLPFIFGFGTNLIQNYKR